MRNGASDFVKEQKIIAVIGDKNLQEKSQKIYLGRET
jgi:hypothetical protein